LEVSDSFRAEHCTSVDLVIEYGEMTLEKKEYGAPGFWPGSMIGRVHAFETPAPLTRAQLDRLRDEFFETRTEGHLEIWTAIRAASHAQEAGDDELAYAIITAVGILPAEVGPAGEGLGERIPFAEQPLDRLLGMICGCCFPAFTRYRTLERVYDQRGFLYETPKECIATPSNVLPDESTEASAR